MLNSGFTRIWHQYTLYNIHTRRSQLCALAKDFAVRRFSPAGSSKATYILYYFIIFSQHKFDSFKISIAFLIINHNIVQESSWSIYVYIYIYNIISDWSIWIILSVPFAISQGSWSAPWPAAPRASGFAKAGSHQSAFQHLFEAGGRWHWRALVQQCWMLEVSTGEEDWQ